MKISIITVCYNSEKTIAQTIESVLEQDHNDIQYLIIDGQSADSTVEIADSYRQQFDEKNIEYIIRSEPDKGIYDAMNKGIMLATGDVIGIINSDDRLAGSDILTAVAGGFAHNQCETLYGNIIITKNNKPYRYWRSGKARTFRYGWMPPHPAFFVKKEVYIRCGVFRLDCGVNADYELMLRLFEKEHISAMWLDKTLTIMSSGGTSDSGLNTRLRSIADNKKAWEVNNMKLPRLTVYLKKVRKLPQFIAAKFVKSQH